MRGIEKRVTRGTTEEKNKDGEMELEREEVDRIIERLNVGKAPWEMVLQTKYKSMGARK